MNNSLSSQIDESVHYIKFLADLKSKLKYLKQHTGDDWIDSVQKTLDEYVEAELSCIADTISHETN